jgi:serpin B
VGAGGDAFAGRLYEVLARKSETFAFSPYSIAAALAMTAAGARGETRAEVERAVEFTPLGALHGDGVRLEIANSLWAQEGLALERAFLDMLAETYRAAIELVDYRGDAEAARRAINDWVAGRTHGKITELLATGEVTQETCLALVNAVYFKASWAEPFEPAATRAGPFYVPGRVVEAHFMRATKTFRYVRGDGFEAIELPYDDGELAMEVILPDAGELAAVERRVAGGGVGSLLAGLAPKSVALALPKLDYGSTIMLVPALGALGIELLFTDRADLSGITREEPLFVSDVVHQATLTVDESGTEAAAATAVVTRAAGMPAPPEVEMNVDRPFIVAVRDRASAQLLFLARVSNPNAG